MIECEVISCTHRHDNEPCSGCGRRFCDSHYSATDHDCNGHLRPEPEE
jgi:hypothetical protein